MSTSQRPSPSAAIEPTASATRPAYGRLRQMGVLRFAGPDAESFLQGQVSNDTRRLRSGEPLLAALSTAQGRVAALLRLLPHSSGILGLLPLELVRQTAERMRKFVLRAKVTIEDASAQLAVAAGHDPQVLAAAGVRVPDAVAGYAEHDGIGVGRVSAAATRYWLIGAEAALAERGLAARGQSGADEAAQRIENDWRLSDIRAGLPQVYAATSELFVAQMLNLDLIDGISFSKGCYTGQEIIARTQHLGRIKRRMFRIALPAGSWTVGQALKLADGRSGRLAEIARDGERCEALAVLAVEPGAAEPGPADAGAASTAALAAIELPLPYAAAASV